MQGEGPMNEKHIITLVLSILLFANILTFANVSADTNSVTVLACSDFQHPNGNEDGKALVKEILGTMSEDGITSADGFLCCGDYDYEYSDTKGGVDALSEAIKDVVSEEMIFVQGNHDSAIGTNGMCQSGNNDPSSGAYGVFVINEDDYMWHNSDESRVKRTAQNLIDYLNAKIINGFDKPIFVVSHLPLHYSMRTFNNGDGMHANYLFDALNCAGEKGLNIIYMYGHDHSNGWDDYLGGAAVYLKKGDNILIAQNSRTVYNNETLNFTYTNPGFVGYYENHNGADDTLTMTVWKITNDSINIVRYSKDGVHPLKSPGVTNSYKNESGYSPDTTAYSSPQTITLTDVTEKTPIPDLIERPTSGKTEGDLYIRITDTDDLKDNGKYLLIYNSNTDYIMTPTVVTKSNASGERTGFDICNYTEFGANIWIDNLSQYLWKFSKSENGWQIGNSTNNIKFIATSTQSASATLSSENAFFEINGSADAFTFSSEGYYLNYNSRSLINGYNDNPAEFYIYEYATNTSSKDACKYLGHKFKDVNAKSPTCIEPGYSDHKVCSRCDKTENKTELKKDTHQFNIYNYNNDATCKNDGTKTSFCIYNCGNKHTVTATGTKLEHLFDDIYDATCNSCTYTRTVPQKPNPHIHYYTIEKNDSSYHWLECTCESSSNMEKHTYDNDFDESCNICAYVRIPPNTPIKEFEDVPTDSWYKKIVNYAVAYGIFDGTSSTTFSPENNMTRAQFVKVLANLEGIITDNYVATSFTDVIPGKWYTGAIKWAYESEIVHGIGNKLFAPNSDITREQMCVMLVNYVEKYKNSTLKTLRDYSVFTDDSKISAWARPDVIKCFRSGLVSGTGNNMFSPRDVANRAQAATIFTNFHKEYLTK